MSPFSVMLNQANRFHCRETSSSSSSVIGIHWRLRVDVTILRYAQPSQQIPLPGNQQQQHCDWDPFVAPTLCHHSPLSTSQPNQHIPFTNKKTSSSSSSSSIIVIGTHWRRCVHFTNLRYRLLNQANRFHCQETSSSSS